MKNKNASRQMIPPKVEPLENPDSLENSNLKSYINQRMQKAKKRLKERELREKCDFTESMMNRRAKAVLNYSGIAVERYKNFDLLDERFKEHIEKLWVDLNMLLGPSYNLIENNSHILYAAAIWILDQITSQKDWKAKLYSILPTDGDKLYHYYVPEIWDTKYDDELILSVVQVLYYRNEDVGSFENGGNGIDRVLTSSLVAKEKHHVDVESRRVYEKLISLIPQEAIQRATENYEHLLWAWIDRFFYCIEPMSLDLYDAIDRTNYFAEKSNEMREIFLDSMDDAQNKQKKKRKNIKNAEKLNNRKGSIDLPPDIQKMMSEETGSFHNSSGYGINSLQVVQIIQNSPIKQVADYSERFSELYENYCDAYSEFVDIHTNRNTFLYDIVSEGCLSKYVCLDKYEMLNLAERMNYLTISNPYEVCFALLWLIDNDSDLPWLYGAGVGLIHETIASLPWGIYEYDEENLNWVETYYSRNEDLEEEDLDDETEEDEEEPNDDKVSKTARKPHLRVVQNSEVKPAIIPDWYDRKYKLKKTRNSEKRSLSQILYEYTGCLMPRNLHQFDNRQRMLRYYGVRGKELTTLLYLFTVLSSEHGRQEAENFNEYMMKYWSGEDITEVNLLENKLPGLSEDNDIRKNLKILQEENKRIRSLLHDTEKSSREIKKELTSGKDKYELEHRELSDLRELLFNKESQTDYGKTEPINRKEFPYEVVKQSVIFGGQEEWGKEICSLLTGNVKYIAKDRSFDLSIVRDAEVIWIQSDNMTRVQFQRISDAARLYKKPVRYFTEYDAERCACMFMNAEMKQ